MLAARRGQRTRSPKVWRGVDKLDMSKCDVNHLESDLREMNPEPSTSPKIHANARTDHIIPRRDMLNSQRKRYGRLPQQSS